MNENKVLINVSAEEIIVSLFIDYCERTGHTDFKDTADLRNYVVTFSEFIQKYLIDRYNLDPEEVEV